MDSNLIGNDRPQYGPSIEFVKTPSGALMVLNFILFFISWCCMADWKGSVDDVYINHLQNNSGFFLFTTVLPWLMYIVFFIILILGFHHRFERVNWPLTFAVNCCVWAFLLLISSSLIASNAKKLPCNVWHCSKLSAASAFGFITMLCLIAQAFFHHREFKTAGSSPI